MVFGLGVRFGFGFIGTRLFGFGFGSGFFVGWVVLSGFRFVTWVVVVG